ncbi:MAG: hypothetical protein AAF740_11970, partial [Bacteroidota bacterium]
MRVTVLFSIVYTFTLGVLAQQGEGTRQLRPTYADDGYLFIDPDPAGFTDFAFLGNTDTDDHLNIYIENNGEVIYYGFGRVFINIEADEVTDDAGITRSFIPHGEYGEYGANNDYFGNTDLNTYLNVIRPNRFTIETNTTDFLSLYDSGNGGVNIRDFYIGYYELIYTPTGETVQSGILPASGYSQGFIGNESVAAYSRAVTGPAQLNGTSGYWALEYNTDTALGGRGAGIYRLEFTMGEIVREGTITSDILIEDVVTTGANNFDLVGIPGALPIAANQGTGPSGVNYPTMNFQLIDITIAPGIGRYSLNSANVTANVVTNNYDFDDFGDNTVVIQSGTNDGRVNSVIDNLIGATTSLNQSEGRVFSRRWGFTVGSFDNTFEANLYPYSNDGVVTEIDFNGIRPFV